MNKFNENRGVWVRHTARGVSVSIRAASEFAGLTIAISASNRVLSHSVMGTVTALAATKDFRVP
jgi:hypothetical protein